jgi:hypothetical protein
VTTELSLSPTACRATERLPIPAICCWAAHVTEDIAFYVALARQVGVDASPAMRARAQERAAGPSGGSSGACVRISSICRSHRCVSSSLSLHGHRECLLGGVAARVGAVPPRDAGRACPRPQARSAPSALACVLTGTSFEGSPFLGRDSCQRTEISPSTKSTSPQRSPAASVIRMRQGCSHRAQKMNASVRSGPPAASALCNQGERPSNPVEGWELGVAREIVPAAVTSERLLRGEGSAGVGTVASDG